MSIIKTPWGDIDFLAKIVDGAGTFAINNKTVLRMTKELAAKQNIPEEVLFRAIEAFDAYFFVGQESRWAMICIKELCADARYRIKTFGAFVAESAADAVRMSAQRAYITACVAADIGEEVARENIGAYLNLEKRHGSGTPELWEKIFASKSAEDLCGSTDAKDYIKIFEAK